MLFIFAFSVVAADLQTRAGHVPRAVSQLKPVAELESTRQVKLAIGLPLRNREALLNLLQQLYDPSSPQYRHFLTPQQFAERFAPTEDDYQRVIAFAKSNHFVITGRHANRLLLDVTASSADINRALHLRLRVYQHPIEPRQFYAPDAEPSLDSRIPVLTIAGLDDFFVPHPVDLKMQLSPQPKESAAVAGLESVPASQSDKPRPQLTATGSGPTGAFLGRDFRNAYAPGVALDGRGESIGLLQFDTYYPNDVSEYEDLAGLPKVPLTNVLVDGFNRLPGDNNGEVALDIAMAISMAPGLDRVFVYEGTIGNDILNRMATDNLARQLSSSWSFGPQVDATREQIFQQFAAQGQSFFEASGDSGAYTIPNPPADDPFVTAVGGTSLVVAQPEGKWVSESAWQFSGGGTSFVYSIPAWQKSVNVALNQGSSTMRNVPDVAALADNVIWSVANNGQQGTVAGTSASAPLWAGFAALVNQQAAANRQPAVGFLNPALYAIGQSPLYASCFHDVTNGNNTTSESPNRFFAVTGYDLVTGWGTPTGSNLINALLAPPGTLQISASAGVSFSGPLGGPFTPLSQTYWLTNAGQSPLSWTLGNVPSWLSASSSSGVINAGQASSVSLNIMLSAAANLAPGSYIATLWFTNLSDAVLQRRTAELDVVTSPIITSQPTTQTLPVGATARFVVTAATNALLSFQWQANGIKLSDGGGIFGSRTAELTLTNVTSVNNGTYQVILSNLAGSTQSVPALLTVTSSPPVIVSQPAGQTVLPAADAMFSVTAYGDGPLSYQWREGGKDVVDGSKIAGAKTSSLRLANVSATDAGIYSVIVSNALGVQTSAEAVLNVVQLTTPELVQDVVYSFNGAADGGHPNGLTLGRDGAFYGTTQTGGKGSGTIFRLDSNNQPQTLYSFNGIADGERPNGDLLQNNDGALLGTTYEGGTNAFGTIFRLDTNNALTTIFTLDHTNGVLPAAGLTQAADGSLFGTAYEGGIFHSGTVFRIDVSGTFSVPLAFASTNGGFPHSRLTLAADGALYGTTYKGGVFGKGTIFTYSSAGVFGTLASLDGTNGSFPLAGVSEVADASLYGATSSGGRFGLGAIFRITKNGVLTNIFSFSGTLDGSHPQAAPILASDGNLYGTTSDGGTFGLGTVFRLSPVGTLTTIGQFDQFNGANPEATLVEGTDGNLYGTTQNGGPANEGVIFRLSVPSSAPKLTSQPQPITAYLGASVQFSISSFGSSPLSYQWRFNGTNLSDGSSVSGAHGRILTISNVTTADSGSYSVSISNQVGSVQSDSANLQVLSSAPFFTLQATNQTLVPGAAAVLQAIALGNLPLTYQWQVNGTNVRDGGNITGASTSTLTIRAVTEANGGTYSLLVSNSLGSIMSSNVVVTVIPVTAPGTLLNTLYSFTGNADGRKPSGLVDGLDGFLYGTTALGGTYRQGSIFKMGTNGGFSSVLSFGQTNGALPRDGLTLATNGLFYGSTSAGGSNSAGTIFTLSRSGLLTTLHVFTGSEDGSMPLVKPVQGPDGALYGAASAEGQFGLGTIFRIDPAGNFDTIYSFSGGIDGSGLAGPLLSSGNSDLFGLTSDGGVFTNGSVFRLSADRAFTNVYSFSGGGDGFVPVGSLVRGDDGALYGATRYNTIRGFLFNGTFFRLTPGGGFTTLYSLNFTDGSYPAAGLLLASDGNFYGTTEQGGANNYGTLFRLSPSGALSTLVEFDGFNDGANPLTALAQGPDGNLYGTTSVGGPGGAGTIFRLSFSGAPELTAQPINQTGYTGYSVAFYVAVTGSSPFVFQWQKNGTNLSDNLSVRGSSSRVLTLSDLTLADAGAYSVVISNALGIVNSASATLSILASPFFQTMVQTNGNLFATWNTVAGRKYQVQSTASLQLANWVSLGSPITATGPSLSATLPIGPNSPGFYRVVLLP